MPKKITTLQSWTDAFIVFASIYLTRHPCDIQGILKYMQTIRLGATRFPTAQWLEYDKQFRLKLSRNTDIQWGSVDAELWILYMSGQSVGPQTHAYTQNYSQQQPSYNQTGPKCFDYNYKGSCNKHPCTYQHLCLKCSKYHPFIQCWYNPLNMHQPRQNNPNFRPQPQFTSPNNTRPRAFNQYQGTRPRNLGPRGFPN